jgi:hypothetical protein
MTPRKRKDLRQPPSPDPLRVTNPHAAGVDVHAGVHWVAVPPGSAPPPSDHPPHLPAHVRPFGACTGWPTGCNGTASRPWRWSRPASTGSRCSSSWSPESLKCPAGHLAGRAPVRLEGGGRAVRVRPPPAPGVRRPARGPAGDVRGPQWRPAAGAAAAPDLPPPQRPGLRRCARGVIPGGGGGPDGAGGGSTRSRRW